MEADSSVQSLTVAPVKESAFSRVPPPCTNARSLIIEAWIQSVELYGTHLVTGPFVPEKISGLCTSGCEPIEQSCGVFKMAPSDSPRTPSPRKSARLRESRQRDRNPTETSPESTPRPALKTVVPVLAASGQRRDSSPPKSPVKQPSCHAPPQAGESIASHSSTDIYVKTLSQTASEVLPSLASSPTKSTATTTSQSTSKSKTSQRSRSPVKRMADLQLNTKPITPKTLTSLHNLPENVRPLFASIRHISAGVGVVPKAIERRYRKRLQITDDELLPHNLRVDTIGQSDAMNRRHPSTMWEYQHELSIICKVASTTRRWAVESVSESAWNSSVYVPLLDLAINGIEEEDATDDDEDE